MKNKAFTLIQLLISLSVLAILFALAVPSYQYLAAKQQADLAKQQLLRAINFARSQAIYHQQQTQLMPNGNWLNGYYVAMQNKRLKLFASIKNTAQLSWRSFPARDYLAFNSQGFAEYQNGTFSYVSKNKKFSWKLIISQSGRVRLA